MNNENSTEKNNSNHLRTLIPELQESKMKPTKPIDYWLYILIGTIVCLANIWINLNVRESEIGILHIWSYFFIIFLVVIPALVFGNFKRPRGYGFIIGYMAGGLIILTYDVFMGAYTLFVSSMLFLIIVIIFKIWRTFDSFKYG